MSMCIPCIHPIHRPIPSPCTSFISSPYLSLLPKIYSPNRSLLRAYPSLHIASHFRKSKLVYPPLFLLFSLLFSSLLSLQPQASSLIINQTPRAPTPTTTAPASATPRDGYQVVDTECYQGEHEEEDDDYYGDDVVLFDHFGGLFVLSLRGWEGREDGEDGEEGGGGRVERVMGEAEV